MKFIKKMDSHIAAFTGTWEYSSTLGFELDENLIKIMGVKGDKTLPYDYDAFLECIYAEDREAFNNVFEKSRTKGLRKLEITHGIINRISGRVHRVRHTIRNFFSDTGEFLGAVGLIIDCGNIDNYLYELNRFYQATENSINAVMFTDPSGKILYINSRFESIYGYKISEIINKNTNILNPGSDVYYDYGYSKQEYSDLFGSLWKNIRDPKKGYWNGQVINRTKDGQLLHIDLYIHAMKDQHGKITSYVGMPLDVTEKIGNEQKIRISAYQAIADLAEQRDNETGKHMKRIGELAYALAKKLRLPRKYCDDIRIFAPLHDIGKVGISDSILLVKRHLSDDEFEKMKLHTEIGYKILKDKPALEMAADIAHCHQEKYDGSGYPRGLSGKNIPLSARITALVDAYDALRSLRPYKQSFPEEETFNIILEESGSHFDPKLVEVFTSIRREFDRIYEQLKD